MTKAGLGVLSLLMLSGLGTGPVPPAFGSQEAQAGAQASGQASAQAGQKQASGNASAAANGSAAAQAGQNGASLAGGTAMNAALTSSVDSKKAKPGDTVTAHTTQAVKSDGKTVVPKGTKLIGHVTQASTRAQGESQSTLGIVFDKAILKNGQEMPLNANIQALAAAQTVASAGGSELDAVGSGGGSVARSDGGGGRGGALGGVTAAAGGAVSGVTNTAANVAGTAGGAVNATTGAAAGVAGTSRGAVGGLNAAGQLTSNSRGVFGLNGLNLSGAASNDTQGSLITSTGKNVHLDSGTRMLLVTQASGGAQGDSKKPEGAKAQSKPEQKPEPKSQPQRQ